MTGEGVLGVHIDILRLEVLTRGERIVAEGAVAFGTVGAGESRVAHT